jgi:hypothetical protein
MIFSENRVPLFRIMLEAFSPRVGEKEEWGTGVE